MLYFPHWCTGSEVFMTMTALMTNWSF
jgi:hypothetical protein